MDVDLVLLDKNGNRGFAHADHGDSSFGVHDAPAPGSDGDKRSASLGRFVVEVVQPVSKVQGVLNMVQFGLDRSDIPNDQGVLFDKFIDKSLLQLHEVQVSLESRLLQFRGEARASTKL